MKILINICSICLLLSTHLSLVTAQETMQGQYSDGSHFIETPKHARGENRGQRKADPKPSVTHRGLLAEAWKLYRAKKYPKAKRLFQKAMQAKDAEVRDEALLGLGYTMKNIGENAEAMAILGKLVQKDYRSAETVPALAELLFAAGDWEKSEELLVKMHHKDRETWRKRLAWSCYRAQDYQCAIEHFSTLYSSDPQEEEYLLACCYALEKLGWWEEAINLLEAWEGGMSTEIASVMNRLYKQKGDSEYKKKNYAQAEHYLAKALKIDPWDDGAMSLIGWSRYHLGDLDGALYIFRKKYRDSKSPESAGTLLLVLEKMGKESQFLSELAADQDPVLRKIAGDHFYQRESPIRAAQTFKSSDSCYYNCDTPWGELFGYYRHRDGDAGLSKLTELAFPIRFHYPMQYGREWVVNITPKYLDAGRAPSEPYAGKFYRSLNDPNVNADSFDDSLWVWEPEVGYNIEDVVNYELRLGATPIGGAVDPMVRFFAQASKKDEWHVNLHQCSVKESILSYVGQTDPYGTKTWGRVLKTGIEGSRTFSLHPPYWFSLDLGYDYYWGKNVKENYSIFGTASAGRTQPFGDGDLSYGLFFSSKHFRRNTDFFTFGHGGYFSPDIFYIYGPFLRYATDHCRDYWFDGQISLGYMHYETENAPHYHETGDATSDLNLSAGNDFNGGYEGDTESGLGVAVKLQGLKFVNDHAAVGGGVSLDSTSEYTEWQVLLTLRLYFQPRKKLCSTKDLFRTVLP